MGSSKKKRGKQRREAKAAAVAASGGYSVASSDPLLVIEDVRRGEKAAVEFAACEVCGPNVGGHVVHAFRERLFAEGIVEIVLGCLSQCRKSVPDIRYGQHQTLKDVASDIIVNPAHWLTLLVNITLPGCLPSSKVDRCRLQIATNIGPLVRCMSSSSMTLFTSREFWHVAVFPYVRLLQNISLTDEGGERLFNQRGCVDFLVQSLFWQALRPDIVQEGARHGQQSGDQLVGHARATQTANDIIRQALDDIGEEVSSCHIYFDERAIRHVQHIALAPIVHKSHDGRSVPFVMGLVDLLHYGNRDAKESSLIASVLLARLVNVCSDRNVISGVLKSAERIDFAHGTIDLGIASRTICAIVAMLIPLVGEKPVPNDNRFAFAVDQGLFEVLLELLVKMRHVPCIEEGFTKSIYDPLRLLYQGAFAASVMMKTSKAVTNRLGRIREAMDKAERALSTSHEEYQHLLRLVKMIVSLKDGVVSSCCRCCERLLAKCEIMRCTACRAVYCSKQCQAIDWKDGLHQYTCTTVVSSADTADGVTLCGKAAKREEALLENINAAADQLLRENESNILAQATLANCHILDCFVSISFIRGPTIAVMPLKRLTEVAGVEERDRCQIAVENYKSDESEEILPIFIHSLPSETNMADSRKIILSRGYPHAWGAAHATFKEKWTRANILHPGLNGDLGLHFEEWYKLFLRAKLSGE